jgi:hypothetical protein
MGGSLDWKLIVTVLLGLVAFGFSYNGLVDYLGERKDGYTAFMVVAGVLITLGGVAMIDWQAAAIALACFAASGTPMVLGDIARTVQRRERSIRIARLIAEARAQDVMDGKA